MIIGVLSDTHDQIDNLEKAFPRLSTAEVILHCGDLNSPFMISRLAEGLPGPPIHIVWGNNEGDTHLIAKVAAGYPTIQLHGPLAQLDLDGFKVAVNHYPEIARGLAHSGLYDLVCYGHDHLQNLERYGDCLLLNPGELLGLKGNCSFALVETGTRDVEFVPV